MNQEPPTAFPWTHDNMTCTGMLMRDYFAAKAMQGLISEPSLQGTVDEFAHRAYVIADAMMGARKA